MTFRRTLRKIFKITGIVIASIIALLLIVILSLRLPAVQEFIVDKALNTIEDKVDTEISVGSIYLDFGLDVVIGNIYVEDQAGDTLLYVNRLEAGARLWDLFSNKLHIAPVSISGLKASIYNTPDDSLFNYQFLIEAFAAPDTASTTADTTSSGMEISIHDLSLEHIQAQYADQYYGMVIHAAIGEFDSEAGLYLDDTTRLEVNEALLERTSGQLVMFPAHERAEDTTSGSPFELEVGEVQLENIGFSMVDKTSGTTLTTDLDFLMAEADSLDLDRSVFAASQLELRKAGLHISTFAVPGTSGDVADTTSASSPFFASASEILIDDFEFSFNDRTVSPKPGFDPAHLHYRQIGLEANELIYKPDKIAATIEQLQAETDGLELVHFQGEFLMDNQHAFAKNLEIETSQSDIDVDIELHYADRSALQEFKDIETEITLAPSTLAPGDLFYFQPDLSQQIPPAVSTPIQMQFKLTGNTDDLQLADLKLSQDNTSLAILSARLQHLLNIDSMYVEVPDLKIATTDQFIQAWMGDSVQQELGVPEELRLQAAVTGGLYDFSGDLSLDGSVGKLQAAVDWKMGADSIPDYEANLETEGLEVGKIMGDTAIGPLTLHVRADGSGLDSNQLQLDVKLEAQSMEYNQYTYKGLNLEGTVTGGTFDGQISYQDRNLDFDFNGQLALPAKGSRENFTLNLTKANLQALNFSEKQLELTASLTSDFTFSDKQAVSGYAQLEDVYVNKEGRLVRVGSILLNANVNDSIQHASLNSAFLTANLLSTLPMLKVPETIGSYLQEYFDADSSNPEVADDVAISFTLDITNPDIISEFLLPQLEYLRMQPITASFDNQGADLELNLLIDSVAYAGLKLDSLGIQVSAKEELSGNLKVRKIDQGIVKISNLWLHSVSDQEQLQVDFRIRDQEYQSKYWLGGKLEKVEEQYRFSFHPDEVVLDYDHWQVKEANEVLFGPSGTWFSAVDFSFQEKQLAIASMQTGSQDTLTRIEANNIQLGALTRSNKDSSALITGILNGSLELQSQPNAPGITTDIKVEDLTIADDELGLLSVNASPASGNSIGFNLSLERQGEGLTLEGNYAAGPPGNLNARLDMNRQSLGFAKLFAKESLSRLDGFLSGNLDLEGDLSAPRLNGRLGFEKTTVALKQFQSELKIDNQYIHFDNSDISFDSFEIIDAENQKAVIDGQIITDRFQSFAFDLDLTSDNFTFLNSEEEDSDLYYGLIRASTDIHVGGNAELPVIDADISLSDDSRFTYIIPENEASEKRLEGVVKFIDKTTEEIGFTINDSTKSPRDDASQITGVNLNAVIEINPENQLAIVIDPVTGDQLSVAGEAILNLSINPSGQITLTGRYEIREGAYNLNFYGLVKRSFEITEGSYIQWSGDPLDARMDIDAVFEVDATPPKVDYSGKLPFEVVLILEQQLSAPEIDFRIQLSEEAAAPLAVRSWLAMLNQDEANRNKQVFGLLILKSFFDDGGGSYDDIAANTARSSVSSFLSGQLNRLSDKMGGVDLSVDIQSYREASSGEGRTELELGVSKRFLNDRIIVKFAGNFDVEGNRSNAQEAQDFAGDIRVEYLLTEDGRYRLVGFRETNYDDLLQGEIIKTGAGFIFIRDYTDLRNLFKSSTVEDSP